MGVTFRGLQIACLLMCSNQSVIFSEDRLICGRDSFLSLSVDISIYSAWFSTIELIFLHISCTRLMEKWRKSVLYSNNRWQRYRPSSPSPHTCILKRRPISIKYFCRVPHILIHHDSFFLNWYIKFISECFLIKF